jgi:adenylate cyclase
MVVLLLVSLPYGLISQGIWLNPVPSTVMLLLILWLLIFATTMTNFSHRRKIYRAFGRYVPVTILKQLTQAQDSLTTLAPRRAEVTVLFADIQGFTRLCETLNPEQLVTMTNKLFTELTTDVHHHNGTLDKYMGDCLMAFWGAPLAQPDHPHQALACAKALQHRMEALQPWLKARNLPPIKLSIALEMGEVTVGNLGSRQRHTYTVMGPTVNLAAHLQLMSKSIGHDLLFGPKLTQLLLSEGNQCRVLGEFTIKGVTAKQRVSTAC